MSEQNKSANRAGVGMAQDGYVMGQRGGIINSQISGPRPAPPTPSPSASLPSGAKSALTQNSGKK